MTTPARTVIDLGRCLDFAAGLTVADAALRQVQVQVHEIDLWEVANDCRGWPGITSAAEVIEHADGASESALESLSRARFIENDLPLPETQVVLHDLPSLRRGSTSLLSP